MSDYLETRLKEYAASSAYPFHMPGHKRSMNPLEDIRKADSRQKNNPGVYGLDITEIDDFDNLHDPKDILELEMRRAAKLWGARETFFSVNGSTCAILVAISAAVPKGGRLLIDRGCHMSVYHAACLRELMLSYIEPDQDDETAVRGIPQGTDAIVITSPSYEGEVRDIRLWADAAHSRGAILIVDEAHGAHLGFHPYFPESAVRLGADLIAQSTHKTLPAMTQTALLHIASDRIDRRKVRFFFDIYETSSPSYVLMASITSAVHLLAGHSEELFEDYARRLIAVRRRLASLTNFTLDTDGRPGADAKKRRRDPGKLVIRIKYPGKIYLCNGREICPDGPWLYDLLRTAYGLQMEMRGPDYVLAMTSIADTDAGYDLLAQSMEEIDSSLSPLTSTAPAGSLEKPSPGTSPGTVTPQFEEEAVCCPVRFSIPPLRLPLWIACESGREYIPLREAEGKIAADFVILYPPDAPLIVPGEEFTQELVREIQFYKKRGFQVIGTDDDQVPCLL